MRAIDRLWDAPIEFEKSWRAHNAAMLSTTLFGYCEGIELQLATALHMAKGFDPALQASSVIENLFDEIEYLKDDGFRALRRNCLLGVCAAFETFAKTVAAALTYDYSWKENFDAPNVLSADTSLDFQARFVVADKEWKNKYKEFMSSKFSWVEPQQVEKVGEVFWIRNQVAHNASQARDSQLIQILDKQFCVGEEVEIDGSSLRHCVVAVRECMWMIIQGTPYLEAI